MEEFELRYEELELSVEARGEINDYITYKDTVSEGAEILHILLV